MELHDKEEIIGNLIDYQTKDDDFLLIFHIAFQISIPNKSISEIDLKNNLGLKIGLFRCDDHHYIRRINDGED